MGSRHCESARMAQPGAAGSAPAATTQAGAGLQNYNDDLVACIEVRCHAHRTAAVASTLGRAPCREADAAAGAPSRSWRAFSTSPSSRRRLSPTSRLHQPATSQPARGRTSHSHSAPPPVASADGHSSTRPQELREKREDLNKSIASDEEEKGAPPGSLKQRFVHNPGRCRRSPGRGFALVRSLSPASTGGTRPRAHTAGYQRAPTVATCRTAHMCSRIRSRAAKIQNDLRILTERLSRINDNLARKVASRTE
eukprot:scaffold1320_cov113-Isochrysis_galbana.AAC.4